MTVEEILSRLEGVRQHGRYYQARCPVKSAHSHGDKNPSLSVYLKENGWVGMTCFAGCTEEAVCAELGIQNIDLLSEHVNYAEPDAVWTYQSLTGDDLFQAVRFPPKRFKQRHYAPGHADADADGWVWNMDDIDRVLYRLPEVVKGVEEGRTIYICEGEKDVESLRAIGNIATCNPGGAGKWREDYNVYLQGANVIIVADRDGPGRKHAERVKTSLQGVSAGIWSMQARAGKDVTDHLEAGYKLTDLEPLRKRVRRGIVSAKEMAEAAREHLLLGEHDLPGFVLNPEIPLIFRQGRTYAIGAYTGHGKTCFALSGFRRLAELGHRVGYFSLEMPERDLTNKLIAHKGIPLRFTEEPWKLRASPELSKGYEEAVSEIERWNADLIFESNITAKRITEITEDREYEAIFVDHLHKFAWTERRKFEEEMQALNNIALELNVMVVVLCQLKKFDSSFGAAQYPAPTLQSFRETSVIGEESSIAMAVWRHVNDDGISYSGQTMAFVLKNRHTTGKHDSAGKSFYLNFDQERELFVPPNTELLDGPAVPPGANGAVVPLRGISATGGPVMGLPAPPH